MERREQGIKKCMVRFAPVKSRFASQRYPSDGRGASDVVASNSSISRARAWPTNLGSPTPTHRGRRHVRNEYWQASSTSDSRVCLR